MLKLNWWHMLGLALCALSIGLSIGVFVGFVMWLASL